MAETAPICVVMRARNDMPLVAETLDALARQRNVSFRLIAFDNDSTDGTRELLEERAERVLRVPEGTYVPGDVLNRAMRETDGEYVVFLNSDCTPQSDDWLEQLLTGFDGPDVAAVFGRQVPRPDCWRLFARDVENTYGDGEAHARWRHCFSMASSAIRRSVWERQPFDESLRYSEDVDWTWRARQAGLRIRYVAASVVMHSHNYSLRQWYRRQYGEGRAEAAIFEWTRWQASWLRYSLLPGLRQLASDWKHCASRLALRAALHAPLLRTAQLLGRRAGLRDGLVNRGWQS